MTKMHLNLPCQIWDNDTAIYLGKKNTEVIKQIWTSIEIFSIQIQLTYSRLERY